MRSQAWREDSGKGDQRGGKVLDNNNTTKDNHNSSYCSFSPYPVPDTGLPLSLSCNTQEVPSFPFLGAGN